jgi:pimeloyl-ACP methyl ester carboxylesterase
MADPGLRRRLAGISTPTRVAWGAADRIADPGYGRVLAAAIPGATFELLPAAGHLPQLEAPTVLDEVIAPRLRDGSLTDGSLTDDSLTNDKATHAA